MINHHRVDFGLRDVLVAAALAHIHNLSRRRRKIENRLRDKIVVQDNIGGLNETHCLDRKQIGVAGTRSHQINRSGESSLRP